MARRSYAHFFFGLSLAVSVIVSPGCGDVAGENPPPDSGSDNGSGGNPAEDTMDDADGDAGGGTADIGVRSVLGNCGRTARDPGNFPNQLVPGNQLHRYTLKAADAVCNDGTPAVIYVRNATNPEHVNDWAMHLQGGGGCTSYEVCEERWCGVDFYDASKMSSMFAPMSVGARGIHNADEQINSFAGWNHVFFYYCSSDSWQGQSLATLVSEDGAKRYTLRRRGHTIIEQAFAELSAGITSDDGEETLASLRDAESVLWTGTSAGSVGARHNADWVRDWFDSDTQVAAVFDAAVTPAEDFLEAELAATLEELSRTRFELRLEQEEVAPFLDESCVAAVGEDNLHRCNVGAYLLQHHVTTPLFIRMDITDSLALGNFRDLGVTREEFASGVRELLIAIGDIQKNGLQGAEVTRRPGLYGPNCGQHVGMEVNPWFLTATMDLSEGGEATFHDALVTWLGGSDIMLIDEVERILSNCETIDDDR